MFRSLFELLFRFIENLQGHEEFDDEITLAGSGRVTPSGELLRRLSESVSPGDTATGPVNAEEPLAEVLQQDPPDQNEGCVHLDTTPHLLPDLDMLASTSAVKQTDLLHLAADVCFIDNCRQQCKDSCAVAFSL